MKNTQQRIVLIALIAVIGFSFTACPTDIGGNAGGLNGTWVNQAGEKWVFNNGSLTMIVGNVESARGTYTASGDYLTINISQVKGSAFGSTASTMGLSTSQWYTKSQFRTAVIGALVNAGYTQPAAAIVVDGLLVQYPLFDPITGTYSVRGNTLTIDGNTTLTREGGGGGTGGTGGGGSNSSLVGTWVEDNVPYNMLLEMTISSNGTVEVKINGILADTGTITTSGNRYTINSTTVGTRTGTFSISGNKLTWIEDGKATQTFTRK